MKFAHSYKLLRPIPGYAAGRTINWHGANKRFYFRKISEWASDNGVEGIYPDFEGPKFTVEQAQDPEWFGPISELVDFIPPFPGYEALYEYVDLLPNCRLVDDVDQCRAINVLLGSDTFRHRLYEFYKQEYNEFHKLGG